MKSKTQTIVGFFTGEPLPPRLSIITTRVDKIGMQSFIYYSDRAPLNNDYNDNEPEAICKVNRRGDKLPLKKNMFLGDQKLKRNAIKKIHDSLNNQKYNLILFEPKVDANNHIYYNISVVDDLSKQDFLKTSVGHTDPSPPEPAN